MNVSLVENHAVVVVGDGESFPLLSLVLELIFMEEGHHIVGESRDERFGVELGVSVLQEGRQAVVLGLVIHRGVKVGGGILAGLAVAGLQAEAIVQGSRSQLAAEGFNGQVTIVVFLLVSESVFDDGESVVEPL